MRAARWETAPLCGACGSSECLSAAVISHRRFVSCKSCGVYRLYDRVAEADLDLLYSGYYPGGEPSPAEIDEQIRNPTFAHRQRRIERYLGARPRRILEVGCGDGNFLARLRRGGWDVQGSEYEPVVAGAVQRRHGIAVVTGDVTAGNPRIGTYPVVAAYHVIEHVYHPAQWARGVRNLVEPGGLLHLQTPNRDALSHSLSGPSWAGLVFPQHVYLYTPATLAAVLERAGFAVLAVTTWDPWHGPGMMCASIANLVRRVFLGRQAWSDRLATHEESAAAFAANVERSRGLRAVPHHVLDALSHPLARAEAALGRGGVVDVIARRTA